MKVFSVGFDHQRYQMVDAIPALVEKHPPTHARAPLLENWEALVGTVDNPSKRRGDFLLCGIHYFVCKREITSAFSKHILGHVQVLPVRMRGEEAAYDLWNVKTYVDALDKQHTKFKPPPFRSMPAKWAFKPESIGQPMLFRTPDVSTVNLVSTAFEASSGDDFYVRYKELKLRGLKFDLLWDSQ